MSDSKPEEIHDVKGTTELEEALVTIELKLDEKFEAAERRAETDDEGAGLILERVLDLIYETFGAVIPYDRIGLAIIEDNGKVLRSRWARSEANSLTMGSGIAAPLDDVLVRQILNAGDATIVNDLDAFLSENPDSEPTRRIVDEGMAASMTCPLTAGGNTIGLMVFSSKEAGVYDEEHKTLFAHIASHVAAILNRSRLYERLIDLNWQLKMARDALEYQAKHDSLTRILNRSAILEVASRELDRARRQKQPITIVMADIDHFKAVNDTHGHLVGDAVLEAVARRLSDALRSYETVGRYGGEEFLIALYDCDFEGAPLAMERLREAVGGTAIDTEKGPMEISISLGGAVTDNSEGDLEDCIRMADEAMYEAKGAGRNRHVTRALESK